MRIHLMIGLILLISGCGTLKNLKPHEYIYTINLRDDVAYACYYKKIKDFAEQNEEKLRCKDFKDLEGWLLIHPQKLKEKLTKGLDELLRIKEDSKPKEPTDG